MGRPPSRDWDVIRERFVTSPERLTHQQLADEFGASRSRISRRAVAEGWEAQRAQYRHQVAAKTRERTSAHEAQIRARQLKIANQMYGLALAQLGRKIRPRQVERDGVMIEVPPEADAEMTIREIRHWLREGLALERQAMGETMEVTETVRREVEEILRRIEEVLSPEDFRRVAEALMPTPEDM